MYLWAPGRSSVTRIRHNLSKTNEIFIPNRILSAHEKSDTPVSNIGWSVFCDFYFGLQCPLYLVLDVLSSFSMLRICLNLRFPRISPFSNLHPETVNTECSKTANRIVQFFQTCQIWLSTHTPYLFLKLAY
jgi:hypothetical protein